MQTSTSPLRLEISLAPNGGLALHLPSGRHLEIGLNPGGLANLRKVLQDAHDYAETGSAKRGYIGAFPTQAVLDVWKAEDDARKEEERKQALAEREIELGISLSTLDISI